MDSKIKSRIITIEKFLHQNIIYIPKYQREYSWQKNNVNTFIDDLLENDEYYLGNILIEKQHETEIIDGQQRIITSILLLAAIKNSKNSEDLSFDNKLIYKNNKSKVNIEDRVSDNGIKIMDYILNDITMTDELKIRNEYVQYTNILKRLNGFDKGQIFKLYNNLLKCQILVIDSSDYSITPYQMFLNLNTKGLRLSNMDIVKSHIFNLLSQERDFPTIKNNWHHISTKIKEKNYDDYLSIYANIKLSNLKKKIEKKEISQIYSEAINKNKIDALNIYNDIGSPSGTYFISYCAVVCNDINNYIQQFSDTSINLQAVFNYFSFIKKINFTQFNVSFISMLFFDNKNKKNIRANIIHIVNFIQFVFLYASLNSLKNVSPSSYGNKFISLAYDLYQNKKDIKSHISKIVNTFVDREYVLEDLSAFDQKVFVQNSKELRIATALISYLDGDSICNYNGEHFISNSLQSNDSKSFGNIIPVVNDIYGNKDELTKIKLYQENRSSEIHIDCFLENDYIDEKYNINERTQRYKQLFLNKINNLYRKLK